MLNWSKLVFGSSRKTTCNHKKYIMYWSPLRCSASPWRRLIYLWARKSWPHLWYQLAGPSQDPYSSCGARSVGNSSNAPRLSNREAVAKKRVKVPPRKIPRKLTSLKKRWNKDKLVLRERKKNLKPIPRKCPQQTRLLIISRPSQTEIPPSKITQSIITRSSKTSTFSRTSFCVWFATPMIGCHLWKVIPINSSRRLKR